MSRFANLPTLAEMQAEQPREPIAKPEPRKRTKARKLRVHRGNVTEVRAYVFARERNLCRCCRFRSAESMHELRPKSLRGRVSKTNSVALCGSGTTGCHGFCQTHAIQARYAADGAEGAVHFYPTTRAAADWMRLVIGEVIESLPMREMEMAE